MSRWRAAAIAGTVAATSERTIARISASRSVLVGLPMRRNVRAAGGGIYGGSTLPKRARLLLEPLSPLLGLAGRVKRVITGKR